MSDQRIIERHTSSTAEPTVASYHAWLLRIWREQPDEAWRVALKRTDGERIGFAELSELFEYLVCLTQGEGRT